MTRIITARAATTCLRSPERLHLRARAADPRLMSIAAQALGTALVPHRTTEGREAGAE